MKIKSVALRTDKKTTLTYGVMLSFVAVAATLFLSTPVMTLASLIDDVNQLNLEGMDVDNPQVNTTTAGLGPEFNWTDAGCDGHAEG